jgi:glycosyltransferase involved in cell wall biosynthesis
MLSRGTGGTERRLARAARSLALEGCPISYLCNGSLVPMLSGTGLEESETLHVRAGWGPIGEMPMAALAMSTRALRGHVIHGCLTGILACALLPPGTRTVVSITAARAEWLGIAGWKWRLYWTAARRAKVVDCLVPEMADVARDAGVRPERVRVGPGSFVDSDTFRPGPKEPVVSYVARFVEAKQPLLFVEAAALVAKRHPDARFVMVGGGPLEGDVRRRADELGLGRRLQIVATYDVAPILGPSLVFASLMTLENYPSQSLLEAMAAGNAVVATDVGRTHLLVDGSTGSRVPSDPSAVAGAIASFLDHPAETEQAGLAARRLVEKSYRIEPYLEYLLDIYRWAQD